MNKNDFYVLVEVIESFDLERVLKRLEEKKTFRRPGNSN